MGRRRVRLALSFVLLTIGLTWFWLAWAGDAYERLLLAVAGPLLEAVGVKGIAESPARQRFVSFVPFLVLTWLTPGLSARRRALGTLLGCAVLFVAHVGLLGIERFSLSRQRPTADPFSTLFPAAIFADSLPFILWALIAQQWLRDRLARVTGRPARADSRD